MPFFVDVITTKRDDPNHITDARKINYNNSHARKWLSSHSNWALRNGLAVHTAAASGNDAVELHGVQTRQQAEQLARHDRRKIFKGPVCQIDDEPFVIVS